MYQKPRQRNILKGCASVGTLSLSEPCFHSVDKSGGGVRCMFATTATPTPRLTSWERRCQYGFTSDAWSTDASQRSLILCTVWTEIPAADVLTLPNHLDQFDENQRLGEIDLWAPRYIDALYKVILNRARDAGDLHLLKRQTLIDARPRLALPTPLRDQWEARFDELAGRGRRP